MDEQISVIVPIYAVVEYLDECVESLLRQSYKNLEIILVDDGSPDNCGFMCDSYAAEYLQIKVIHKENGGLSDARNAGLKASTAEYVLFVDSDDFLEPTMIETLYVNLINYNADISVCGINKAYSDGRRVPNQGKEDVVLLDKFQATKNLYTFDSYGVGVWNKLFKRELLLIEGFPVGKLSEDYFVMFKYFMAAQNVVDDSTPLYNYRQREQSITKKKRTNIGMYEGIEKYYKFTRDVPELEDSGTHAIVFGSLATYNNIMKNKDYTELVPDLKKTISENYKQAMRYESCSNRKLQLFIFKYFRPFYPLAYKVFMSRRQ